MQTTLLQKYITFRDRNKFKYTKNNFKLESLTSRNNKFFIIKHIMFEQKVVTSIKIIQNSRKI